MHHEKETGLYRVRINVNGKKIHVGRYTCPNEAARHEALAKIRVLEHECDQLKQKPTVNINPDSWIGIDAARSLAVSMAKTKFKESEIKAFAAGFIACSEYLKQMNKPQNEK